MYQGETITTTVTGFPVPLTAAQNVHVVFRDRNGVCLEIDSSDGEIVDDDTFKFKLTQEDSLQLTAGRLQRSVIVIMKDGSRMESNPSDFVVNTTAREGVLT